MIKVVIIEDETILSDHITSLLDKYCSSVNFVVECTAESVKDAVCWLNEHDSPDLIFMDVNLSDGSCFDILNKVKVTSPIIYTTAFDEHVIEAFRTSAVSYLLKPITEKDFYNAIVKFLEMRRGWE